MIKYLTGDILDSKAEALVNTVNTVGTMAVGIIISYIVWKHKNMYLGIAIHASINMLGALGDYLSILEGMIINR